jgi:hypothetical protein
MKRMLSSLLAGIVGAFDRIYQSLKAWVGPLVAKLMLFFAPLIAAAYWVCTEIVGWISGALATIGSIELPGLPGTLVGSWLEIINCFIPLADVFAAVGVYLAFLAVLGLYKFVKSWIPTVAT